MLLCKEAFHWTSPHFEMSVCRNTLCRAYLKTPLAQARLGVRLKDSYQEIMQWFSKGGQKAACCSFHVCKKTMTTSLLLVPIRALNKNLLVSFFPLSSGTMMLAQAIIDKTKPEGATVVNEITYVKSWQTAQCFLKATYSCVLS